MADTTIHQARRRALMAELGQGAALIPAGRIKTRSRTVTYPFRPDSDFWYLTGFGEPEAALLLLPGHERHETVLFLRERDPASEAWDGPRLGVEDAPGALGVDAALPFDELERWLPELLGDRARSATRSGTTPSSTRSSRSSSGPARPAGTPRSRR